MKHNGLGFDFPVFDVHFVAAKDNGNVLADTDQVTMPVGHILIGNTRGDVEHDDSALSCEGSREVVTCYSMAVLIYSDQGLITRTARQGL